MWRPQESGQQSDAYDIITLQKMIERDYTIPEPQAAEEVIARRAWVRAAFLHSGAAQSQLGQISWENLIRRNCLARSNGSIFEGDEQTGDISIAFHL